MIVTHLPHVNAGLNAIAAVLILTGYVMIRQKRVRAHRAYMLGATGVSIAFLVCYLAYHYHAGSVRFDGPPVTRTVYLAILLSHSVLAAATPFLVVYTLYRAFRGQLDRHRRVARWTLPIWLYVSLTGVIVYLMLYHLYRTPPG